MASTDAVPVPRKNTAFRVTFPLYDADGDLVTGASSLDSEVSKDGGTFADCTNEATEIATSSGMYYLDLTSTEMNADTVAVIVKSASAKTLPLVFYPEEAGDIRADAVMISGDATAADNAELMFDGTGYAGGTAKLTVDVVKWNGTAVASPASAGYPAVTLKVGTGTGEVNLASGKAPATIAAGDIANSAITAASIAADAITDAKVASDVTIASVTGAVGSVTGAVGSVTGAVGSVTGNVGGNVTGSVGSVVGAVGSVTGAVGSVTGNVGGNVVGSVASVTAGVNATQINSSANAAARLALAAAQMIPGTVDSTAFSPTTTVFEADDITEATADHYNGRLVLWTSGALVGQVTDVTDYALSGGRGRFTCTTMTEAAANNDTFILV